VEGARERAAVVNALQRLTSPPPRRWAAQRAETQQTLLSSAKLEGVLEASTASKCFSGRLMVAQYPFGCSRSRGRGAAGGGRSSAKAAKPRAVSGGTAPPAAVNTRRRTYCSQRPATVAERAEASSRSAALGSPPGPNSRGASRAASPFALGTKPRWQPSSLSTRMA